MSIIRKYLFDIFTFRRNYDYFEIDFSALIFLLLKKKSIPFPE